MTCLVLLYKISTIKQQQQGIWVSDSCSYLYSCSRTYEVKLGRDSGV